MKYRSNGKLLISGEYLVMYGALALAVPVKFTQDLRIETSKQNYFSWKTFVLGKLWFEADFNKDLSLIKTNDEDKADFLLKLLKAAQSLNKQFLSKSYYNIKSDINFDINWGLGSSSTLINNVAQWAKINPFDLFFKVANGSAYDIACAFSDKPILYRLINQKPEYHTVDFYPAFHQNIYFAYLGKKQKSEESIGKFKKEAHYSEKDIAQITEITNKMLTVTNFKTFSQLICEHENILSRILKQKPVKEKYFNDFQGEIKSLGAWGGDFIMIASKLDIAEVKKYFLDKGINTIFTFKQIIL